MTSDVSPPQSDPNAIMDPGYPRSAEGISSALALCDALTMHFEIHHLESEPVYHGYGMKCSEAHLVIGIWGCL